MLTICIGLLTFLAGYWYGGFSEAQHWRSHAGRRHRTPIHNNHSFYYVVPEAEYVDLEIDHNYLEKIRHDCAVNGG